MPEVDFSSKELARIIYLIDEGKKKRSTVEYKARYEKLLKEIGDIIARNTYSKTEDKDFTEKMSQEDEELQWKLKVVQKQVHKDEIDEAKDDEDWEHRND